jgi:hypothetical protein
MRQSPPRQICTEHDDVLLTAAGGQCIRFPVTDVRVFTGRTAKAGADAGPDRRPQAMRSLDRRVNRG